MTLQYGQYLKKINGNLKKETSFKRSKLDDLSSHGGQNLMTSVLQEVKT